MYEKIYCFAKKFHSHAAELDQIKKLLSKKYVF